MKHENNLWAHETWINETKKCSIGNYKFYETFTNNTGELFKDLQKKYGRAKKMYIDLKKGVTIQTGWIFTKKVKYTDCNDYYIQSVWVKVFKEEPKKTITWEMERAEF